MAEQIVGPDAQGNYSLVRDGQVIQTWNPSTTFAPGTAAARKGKTSSFDASGEPLPPQQGIPATPEGAAAAAAPPIDPNAAAAPAPVADDWYASPAPRGGGGGALAAPATRPTTGYQQTAAAPATSIGGGGEWFDAPPADFGGTTDPFSNIPNYRDGTRHPAAGGSPRVPGGPAAMQDDGGFQKPAFQPDTGAYAAPGNVQSPRSEQPSHLSSRGFNSDGNRGGGGGAHPLHSKLMGQAQGMAARLRGEGGPPATSPGGSSGVTSQKEYNQLGREMDRAWEDYNDQLANPDPLRVTGWSKRQGFKPGTIEAVLGDPTLLLESAVPGYQSRNTFSSEAIEAMPMTDIALIMEGTHGKSLTSKTPVPKVPGVLRKHADVKPEEPDHERMLDPSKVANHVAGMWRSLNEPGVEYGDMGWMDRDKLVHKLATAKPDSILRQNLETQFEEDPNAAMHSAASYLRSAMSTGPRTLAQRALVEDVDRRVTNMGTQILRMKPEDASKVVNRLARSYT